MSNPFKFGSVVGDEFFTDRKKETKDIKRVLESSNHLILISPRRYGKTSLILKVTKSLRRPLIYLDLQLTTDTADMAAQLMKRVLKINKWENIKQSVRSFRVVPIVEMNPLTGGVEVAFRPSVSADFAPLEDVLNLIDDMGKKKKPIVILDEFQEIASISGSLPKKLRSVIQHHANVNYVFLGSAESMMKEIFMTKKSPFYHFGHLMSLSTIPYRDFLEYIEAGLDKATDKAADVAAKILDFTGCHPYYTQQLAFYCYSFLEENGYSDTIIDAVVGNVIEMHDNDFEKLWNTFGSTDKKIIISLAEGRSVSSVAVPTSTIYSGLKRLSSQGYVVKNDTYELDDPFFARWIALKRS